MIRYKHAFAKAWLHRQGHQILINDNDFFSKDIDKIKKKFSIKPLTSYIRLGELLIDEEDLDKIQTIPFYEMRRRFSYTIYKLPLTKTRKAWRPYQKDVLILARRSPDIPGEIPLGTFKRRHLKIQYNPFKKTIRGVGEGFGTERGVYSNGDITPWIVVSKRKRIQMVNRLVVHQSPHDITKALLRQYEGKSVERVLKQKIKELPVFLTTDGDLLCFPKSRNLPKILFVGKTRGGKTYAMASIMGRIFYVFEDRICLLNDSLNQFYDLSLPNDKTALNRISERIGNKPRHLPTVNLYMSCPNLRILYEDEDVSYRLVLSLKEFIKRWDWFAHGVKKWDIGSPFKYIDDKIMNIICSCSNKKELQKKLYGYFQEKYPDEKEFKQKKSMIEKWCAALDKVFIDEFTNNHFKDDERISPVWKVITKDGKELVTHPVIACLEATLIPVVNNYLAKEYPIAKKQMADLIRKIVRHQMLSEVKKRIWVCIDELKDFLDKKGSRGDDLLDALDYLFTQGAFNNLGFAATIQEYSKITNSMRNNASHLFVFEMASSDERKLIAADYDLDKDKLAEIKDLPKHHCLFTTKEKVVIYNKEGSRKVVEGGMWVGKVLPTITVHKSAGE